MASYTLITMAFLFICSSSFIETSSAARSNPTSATNVLVHPQSEPVKPPVPTNNDNKAQSKDLITPPYPFYYPLSGPGYPYYGQGAGQPYSPYPTSYPTSYPTTYPTTYPYSPYPTSYPYSPYNNPTLPFPQGPSIYTPPSNTRRP